MVTQVVGKGAEGVRAIGYGMHELGAGFSRDLWLRAVFDTDCDLRPRPAHKNHYLHT